MHRIKIYSLLLVQLLLSLFLSGQDSKNIIAKHFYSVEDGLASREIFCAIQDNDGFMWFGTRNGLNRYDGKNFKLFTKQSSGFSSNRILNLAKDNSNHLFLVYGNPGFARSAMRMEVFDLKTHQIKSLKEVFPDLPFDEKYLYWISNGGDDLCFLVSNPFRFWKYSNGKFELKCEMRAWDNMANNPEDLPTANGAYHTTTGFHCIFRKEYAVLFLGNNEAFYYVTPDTVLVDDSPIERGIIAITPGNEVLVNSNEKYGKLTLKGELKIGSSFFIPPLADEAHKLYYRKSVSHELMTYSEDGGLFLYDFKAWCKLLDKKDLKIASGNSLYGFYKDHQENFWVCTSTGLIKVKIENNPFKHYFTKVQLNDNLENQSRGIYLDSAGAVYANLWTKFACNKLEKNLLVTGPENHLKYALAGEGNLIYIGGQKFLSCYEIDKKRLSRICEAEELTEIWSLSFIARDKLLLGCSDNLYTFNLKNNQLKPISYSSQKIPIANFVYRFLKSNDGKVWVVAQNGLYLLNDSADTLLDFFGKQNGDSTKQLPFDVLLDAYKDEDGVFWFATSGEGLYRWDRKKSEFRQFNSSTGLPSDVLYRIEADDFNNLWISTDNGLVRFNRIDFRTNIFNTSSGLSHNEFNRTSSYKAKDGRLFFGGLDGVNAFYPKDFKTNSKEENLPLHVISFTKFSADENKLEDKTSALLSENKIILKPGDRFFNLEFQLLDFEEGKLNYAYKIEGVDKDWNYINENSLRVSGLPYGNFILQIKSQGVNGQWSKNELNIPVLVLKPFYLQWWFLVLSFFLVIVSIVVFLRWRTNRLHNAKLALESTVLERTEQLKASLSEKDVLLKEIHHRVKNNLQVISALLEMQRSRIKDHKTKEAISESQNRVLSIAFIHQNLYQHEDIKSVEVRSFVNELVKHIHSVFSRDDREVKVENHIPETFLDIDTAVPLGLITNELLTNSYKYAFNSRADGKIELSLILEEIGSYKFIYTDNGIGLPTGIDLATVNTLGLRLVRQLCKQLCGKLHYLNQNGCRFEFTLKDYETRSKM